MKSPKATRNCEMCGKEFVCIPSAKTKYCSRECFGKNKKKVFDAWEIKICKECEKEFKAYKYRNVIFCSNLCKSRYGAKQPKPKARKNIYIIKPCAWCAKPHRFSIHQIRLRGGKYCSVACARKGLSNRMRGAGNVNWVGGISSYRGPNWSEQAKATRKRDKFTCQICGVKYVKGGPVRTDVHHITPFRLFNGDYESANKLTNLIVLCRRCHKQVELGKIQCPLPLGAT